VKSAVLLAGLFADGATVVEAPAQSRDHTERMLAAMGVRISGDVAKAVRQPDVKLATLVAEDRVELDIHPESAELDVLSLETSIKYAGYLSQEASRAARTRRDERRKIPAEFSFDGIPGLSREVVQRLTQVRPETLGQAARIPGMTPAAVAVLGVFLGRLGPEWPLARHL